jgi:hypothetical protein
MRTSFVPLVLLALLMLAVTLSAQAPMPRVTAVDPVVAKVGDELTATGENLDKGNVHELRVTDGKADTRVAITDQTATTIKFKVPGGIKAGRYALVTVTKRIPSPLEIEQPVKFEVQQ